MLGYIFKRLLLIIPTVFTIMLINFAIVQFAPGGPIEQVIAKMRGMDVSATARFSGESHMPSHTTELHGKTSDYASKYAGAYGIDPELIRKLEKMYGFDKPAHERFFKMIKDYLKFDFGESYFKSQSVLKLILDKMPVSVSLGLWSTLLIYLISIPLGIRKAVHDGSKFDIWTSTVIIVGYAIPSFLFGILLIILFAGGSFLDWFPLRNLVSDNWDTLGFFDKIKDYFWHVTLPIVALTIGGFASMTLLTKNSFLEEIQKQYVLTARAKGLSERRVLYGHIFRNAMLVVISGMPAAFLSILFTGALLIEVIFSLDGLGLLGFEAVVGRDYPVVFGTLYFFTLLSLVVHLIGDITYMLVDRRIDFEKRIG